MKQKNSHETPNMEIFV